MRKVVPYIKIMGSERFKEFLATPFTVDMLYPVFNDKSCETLFDDWRGKNMVNWYKFSNGDKIILEFFPTYYSVKRDKIVYMLALPETLNDFINDMDRFGIQLYWSEWIDNNFEPKEYLERDEIHQYFVELLGRMGKSHELL